jgi:hypothetical protein
VLVLLCATVAAGAACKRKSTQQHQEHQLPHLDLPPPPLVQLPDIALPARTGFGDTLTANHKTGIVYAGLLGDQEKSSIAIANAGTGQLLATVPVPGRHLSSIAVDESRDIVYVSVWSNSPNLKREADAVIAFDAARRTVLGTIFVQGGTPGWMTVDPATQMLFAYAGGESLQIVDVQAMRPVQTIPLPGYAAAANPAFGGLLLDRSGRRLWIVGKAKTEGRTLMMEMDTATRQLKPAGSWEGVPIALARGWDPATSSDVPWLVARHPEGIFTGDHNMLKLPLGYTPNEALADFEGSATPTWAYLSSHVYEGSFLFRVAITDNGQTLSLKTAPVTLGLEQRVARQVMVLGTPPGSGCETIVVDYAGPSLWRWSNGCAPK